MPTDRFVPLPKRLARVSAGAGLAVSLHAGAALLVYEPFDYPAPSLLNGTTATGLDLAGTYVSDVVNEVFQLRVSAPGLGYGNLAGAPGAAGGKLTQLRGTTSNGSVVGLAQPVPILPGEAIFFSALFTFNDAASGNRFARISLIDEVSGGSITFGETVAGVRAIRASADTPATGGQRATGGDDRAFDNGQTLLLIGRYNNSALASGDRLELLGYDTAANHALPGAFDPNDPNTVLYQELDGIDIDLERISSLRFAIRGDDNNFIDELRIGSTLADVAPVPEPRTWLLVLCGIAAVAGTRFRANRCFNSTGCSLP
jgi:hypothetical protein